MGVEADMSNKDEIGAPVPSVRKGLIWIAVAMVCFIIAVIILTPASNRQAHLMAHGVPVEGTVKKTTMGIRGGSKSSIVYHVDGVEYCACIYDHVGQVGESVTVYVDPTDPEVYTLEEMLPQGAIAHYAMIISFSATFLTLFLALRHFWQVFYRRWFRSPREVPA